ncbi:hypothetical protein AVEN_32725-1, partial [Araneus ventricosus]
SWQWGRKTQMMMFLDGWNCVDAPGESNHHKFFEEQSLLGHNTPMYQLDGEGWPVYCVDLSSNCMQG